MQMPLIGASSAQTLRDYQVAAVEATERELEENRGTLILLATGLGKTQCASELIRRWPGRSLFIAHRDELIQQAANRIEQFTGQWPDIEQADLRASRTGSNCVVASIQTLSRRKRLVSFLPDAFDLIVVDECFPAGTMVDGRPIETIKPGDMVTTHTGLRRRVTRVFKKKTKSLVRLSAGGTTVTCTPNHRFLLACGEWVEASYLQRDSMVLCIRHDEKSTLRPLWGPDPQDASHQPRSVLRPMYRNQTGGAKEEGCFPVCDLRNGSFPDWPMEVEGIKEWVGVLQRGTQGTALQRHCLEEHNSHKQEVCIREDEGKQSHAQERREGEGCGKIKSQRMAEACESRREWQGANLCTDGPCGSSWLGDGSCYTNPEETGHGLPDMLQGGYRKQGSENCCRGGRTVSWVTGETAPGQEEGIFLEAVRVDGVEVLQQGDFERHSGMRTDCVVYDLEVEVDHSYNANGFIVHNCHRALAASYTRTLEYFTGKIVGLTATPDRLDGKALGQVLDSIAYRYDITDAIADGWLCEIIMKRIRVDSLDFSGIRKVAGDLHDGELARLMTMEKNLHGIAKPTVELAGDRKSIVFATSVAHAERLAEIINRYAGGEKAMCISGQTDKRKRRQMLREFADGQWQYFVNVGIATEGYDCPDVSCIVMARHTMSRSLYCFDSDTELLTRRGWVRGVDVVPGEIVAAFNKNSGVIDWQVIEDYVRRKTIDQEKMVSVSTGSVDFRVTDNHRMLVRHKVGHRKTDLYFTDAGKLQDGHWSFDVPVSGYAGYRGIALSDHEIAFVAWAQTDGCHNKINNAISISQQSPEQCKHIEETLTGCGLKWRVSENNKPTNYGPRKNPLRVYRVSRGAPRKEDKDLSGWGHLAPWIPKVSRSAWFLLSHMSDGQFEIFLEVCQRANGAKWKNVDWTPRGYTISFGRKEDADAIQAMCVTRGWRANVSKSGSVWMLRCKKSAYRSIRKSSVSVDDPWPGEVVWCVSVPNGSVVVRRNGKTMIAGNCQMMGRGTRGGKLCPVGDKRDLLVLDYVGLTGKHDIVSAIDVLGGDMEPLRLERAKEAVEASEQPMSAKEADDEVERQIQEQTREAAKRRESLVAEVRYTVSGNPYDDLGVKRDYLTQKYGINPATEKQLSALMRWMGKNKKDLPRQLSKHEASRMLQEFGDRREQGLCTYSQMKLLGKRGVDSRSLSFKQASTLINWMASHGWANPPASVVERVRNAA